MNCEFNYKQIQSFTKMISAVKDQVTDVMFDCDPKYMTICNMDDSHTVLVYCRFRSKHFDNYQCDKTLNIGVNLKQLHKMLKTIKRNETVTMIILRRNDELVLSMNIKGSKHNCTLYLDNIIVDNELNYKSMTDNISELPVQLRLSSDEWKSCVDRLKTLDFNSIELKYHEGILSLNAGDKGNLEIEIVDIIKQQSELPIVIRFDIDKLSQISKCSLFSDELVIYFHENELYPTFFLFTVDKIGHIIYGLSSRNE